MNFYFLLQIASLKAALVRKDVDGDQLQHSRSCSPERFRMKSTGSSPLHPSSRSVGDMSGGIRQPMEDVGEVCSTNHNW